MALSGVMYSTLTSLQFNLTPNPATRLGVGKHYHI